MIRLSLHRINLWASGINFGAFLVGITEGKYKMAAINFFVSVICYGVYHILDDKLSAGY
jgi:hypothetical protein